MGKLHEYYATKHYIIQTYKPKDSSWAYKNTLREGICPACTVHLGFHNNTH